VSLHCKLVITRWLERANPGERRQWKKYAAAAARKRRESLPAPTISEQREALFRKLTDLIEKARARSTSADSAGEPGPEE
jgi:hypothetical protein